MPKIETKPYFETVERFLKRLQSEDVVSVVCVARLRDGDTGEIVDFWNAGPGEKAMFAGLLNSIAAAELMAYWENETEEENTDGDDEEDGNDEERWEIE